MNSNTEVLALFAGERINTMTRTIAEVIASAIDRNLASPNVADSNWEAANVVDVINKLAVYIDAGLSQRNEKGVRQKNVVDGLFAIADGLFQVAFAIRDSQHSGPRLPIPPSSPVGGNGH
jgi:hypothetical protein